MYLCLALLGVGLCCRPKVSAFLKADLETVSSFSALLRMFVAL